MPDCGACGGLQIDLVAGMMDCLYAQCTPCVTDCVVAELEKLGQKYRVALKVAKARWPCAGQGFRPWFRIGPEVPRGAQGCQGALALCKPGFWTLV